MLPVSVVFGFLLVVGLLAMVTLSIPYFCLLVNLGVKCFFLDQVICAVTRFFLDYF